MLFVWLGNLLLNKSPVGLLEFFFFFINLALGRGLVTVGRRLTVEAVNLGQLLCVLHKDSFSSTLSLTLHNFRCVACLGSGAVLLWCDRAMWSSDPGSLICSATLLMNVLKVEVHPET